jgi:hypothetical protein
MFNCVPANASCMNTVLERIFKKEAPGCPALLHIVDDGEINYIYRLLGSLQESLPLKETPLLHDFIENEMRSKRAGLASEEECYSVGRLVSYIATKLNDPIEAQAIRKVVLLKNLETRMPAAKFSELLRKYRDPFRILQSVSQENLERMNFKTISESLTGIPDLATRAEIELYAGKIDFKLRHFANTEAKPTAVPVMSSGVMKQFGFRAGINSSPFNLEFLRTGDNVFFFIDETLGASFEEVGRTATEYGPHGVEIKDREFAEKNGMVSYFIMYPRQYVQYLKEIEGVPILQKYEKLDHDWDKSFETDLGKDIETLHHLDFTLADYREMVRRAFVEKLVSIYRDDPSEFAITLKRIGDEDKKKSRGLFSFAHGSWRDGFLKRYPMATNFDFEYKSFGFVEWNHLAPL